MTTINEIDRIKKTAELDRYDSAKRFLLEARSNLQQSLDVFWSAHEFNLINTTEYNTYLGEYNVALTAIKRINHLIATNRNLALYKK